MRNVDKIGWIIAFLALILVAAEFPGAPRRIVQDAQAVPMSGAQQLTVTSGAVVNLTPPDGATIAHIQAYDGNVRYRDDGIDPTTTTGICLFSTLDVWYHGNLDVIGLIAETGTVEVNVLYYQQ